MPSTTADPVYWVDVLPAMDDFIPTLRRELTGVTGKLGRQAGADFSQGFNAGASGIGKTAGQVDQVTGSTKELASAQGKAAAGSRELASGLDKVDGSAAKTSGRLDRVKASLGALATGGVTAAVGAIGAAGTIGIRTAAELEQASIGFTTMLGSAEQAGAFLGDLKKFAGSTPFEFPELQTAASSLISVGIGADKVIPIMTTLGNVTSGMGTGSEGIQRATVALQQMTAAGKIQAEDLNQLRDAGIPVYDLLASALGKSKSEVVELAQSGKLGQDALDKMMLALENGTGLERFTGLMEKQSTSLNGLWSTLKDTFKMGMSDAITPLVPLIKDGLGGAIEWTTAMMPKIAAGLATVTTKAMEFGAGVKGVYDILAKGDFSGPIFGQQEDSKFVDVLFRIREGLIGIYDLVVKGDFTGNLQRAFGWEEDSRAVGFLLGIRDRIREIIEAVKADGLSGFIDQLKRTGDAASPASGFLSAVAQNIGAFGSAIGGILAGALPLVLGLLQSMGGVMQFLGQHTGLLTGIMITLGIVFTAVKVGQAAANVAALASLPIRVAEIASNLALASAYQAMAFQMSVMTGVQRTSMIGRIAATAATVASTVATTAASAASKAWAATQWLLNAALSANPLGLVVIALAAVVAGLVIAWKNSETFRSIVLGAWDAVKTGIGVLVAAFIVMKDRVVEVAQTVAAWVVDRFTWLRDTAVAAWRTMSTLVSSAFTGLRDGVVAIAQGIWTLVSGIFTRAFAAWLGMWMAIIRTVIDIWTGFRNGVVAIAQAVWDLVSGIFTRAVDGWTRIFTGVRNVIVGIWTGFRDLIVAGAQALWTLVSGIFTRAVDGWTRIFTGVRDTVVRVWTGFRDTVVSVAQNVWDWVSDRFNRMRDSVVRTFEGIRDTVGRVWDGIQDKIKSPLRIAFQFVNSNMINPVNDILGKFPGNLKIPSLPALAGGGLLRGPGTGTSDSILGVDPRSGVPTAAVSHGEFVVNAKQTRKHFGLISAINAGIGRFRDGGPIGAAFGVPGFDIGGLISGARDLAVSGLDKAKDAVSTVKNFATDMIAKGARKAAEAILGPIRDSAKSLIPSDKVPFNMLSAGIDRLYNAVLGKGDEADKQQASLSGGTFAGIGKSTPNGIGGLGPAAAAARDFVMRTFGIKNIGGYANRNIAGTGTKSDHALGKAIDVMIPNYKSPAGIALGNAVASHFVNNPSQFGTKYVIWKSQINSGSGWKPYGHPGGGRSDTLQHEDHDHISFFHRGGRVVPDGRRDIPAFLRADERVHTPPQDNLTQRLIDANIAMDRRHQQPAEVTGAKYYGDVYMVDPAEQERARRREFRAVAAAYAI